MFTLIDEARSFVDTGTAGASWSEVRIRLIGDALRR